MIRSLSFVAVLTGCAIVSAPAGEFNKKLSIGDAAPVWANLPGVDGKKHSLADFKDKPIVVLAFTCNSCPVAQLYQDRLVAFAKKYAGPNDSVAVVAVNVNTIDADKLPKMEERAKEAGFTFPYLYDETQKIAQNYGATFTPEFFVIDKDRKIAYMGAMDDATQPPQVKVRFLEDAVDAVLKGAKPSKGETLARGCAIRFNRPRR